VTSTGTAAAVRGVATNGIGTNGVSTSGVGQQGLSNSGIGALGTHGNTTGMSPGVQGETNSTDPGGAGVVGKNMGGGPGLRAIVNAGASPLAVNSSVKVANLNADKLDDLDSAALQKRVSGTCAAGSAVKTVNADGTVACEPVGGGGVWSLTGNSGTTPGTNFVGTTDNQPLELKVNGQRALRLEPDSNSPNLVGGSSDNFVEVGHSGSVIAGGGNPTDGGNRIWNDYDFIGSGLSNQAGTLGAGGASAVVAGSGNWASGGSAFIGAGGVNTAEANYAAVVAGQFNHAQGIWSLVGGGKNNTASGDYSLVAGGGSNAASADHATVGGGESNNASGHHATVAGGQGNSATVNFAAIGGGLDNSATGLDTVAGGLSNTASGGYSAIGGGRNNQATGDSSVVIGGNEGHAGGNFSTVAGGEQNIAGGRDSFAAGSGAHANHDGTFVWGDSTPWISSSSGPNQFIARAGGHFFLETTGTLYDQGGFINTSTGANLTLGGVWTNNSDRTKKQDFRALDKHTVLETVARMPITSWRYKAEKPSVRHIGPMAQDFYKAFGLGLDNKHITTIDEGGVALAAIQGLYRQNQALERRLSVLEHLLQIREGGER
jgi:hypothetical protein